MCNNWEFTVVNFKLPHSVPRIFPLVENNCKYCDKLIKLLLFKILKNIWPIFAWHIIKKLKEMSLLCHWLLFSKHTLWVNSSLLFWLCLRCEIEQQEQTRKNSILSLKLVILCTILSRVFFVTMSKMSEIWSKNIYFYQIFDLSILSKMTELIEIIHYPPDSWG